MKHQDKTLRVVSIVMMVWGIVLGVAGMVIILRMGILGSYLQNTSLVQDGYIVVGAVSVMLGIGFIVCGIFDVVAGGFGIKVATSHSPALLNIASALGVFSIISCVFSFLSAVDSTIASFVCIFSIILPVIFLKRIRHLQRM